MFKPRALCQECGGDLKTQLISEGLEFRRDLTERGLAYREARPGPHPTGDRWRLYEFFRSHGDPFLRDFGDGESWTDMPRTDRAIRYGLVTLIEEIKTGEIVAAQAADLFADPAHTAHALQYAVAKDYRGRGLGGRLVWQHAVDCMRRGMGVRRGSVNPSNTASLVNLLNEVGGIVTDLEAYLYAPKTVLVVTLALTYHGLCSNRIDAAATAAWVRAAEPGDYALVPAKDLASLTHLYAHTEFRIVAIMPPPDSRLLLVPLMGARRTLADLPQGPARVGA